MTDPVAALEALGTMRDRGLITEAEYQERRPEILARLGGVPPSPAPAPVQGSHPGIAGAMYDLETLRVKLVVGRVIGVAIGLAIWWFVLGPMLAGDFIPTVVSLVVVAFGGIWLGTMATLAIERSGR